MRIWERFKLQFIHAKDYKEFIRRYMQRRVHGPIYV
jgi:hypothetical protein